MYAGAEFSTQMEQKIPYLMNPLGRKSSYAWYIAYGVVYCYLLINRDSSDYGWLHILFLIMVAVVSRKHSFGESLNLKRNYEKIDHQRP